MPADPTPIFTPASRPAPAAALPVHSVPVRVATLPGAIHAIPARTPTAPQSIVAAPPPLYGDIRAENIPTGEAETLVFTGLNNGMPAYANATTDCYFDPYDLQWVVQTDSGHARRSSQGSKPTPDLDSGMWSDENGEDAADFAVILLVPRRVPTSIHLQPAPLAPAIPRVITP